jgi:hypothetical protein
MPDDPKAPDEKEPTYRVLPASHDLIQVVKHLLQQGADPNYGDGVLLDLAIQRQSMMHHGAKPCRDHAILQILLDAGANIIDLALVAAAETGDKAAIPKLLAAPRAPVDPSGQGLLLMAREGRAKAVEGLMLGGANVGAALQAVATSEANASNIQAATLLLQHSQVTDQGLKQQLVDLAARSQSFSLMWALCRSVGMLEDCELAAEDAGKAGVHNPQSHAREIDRHCKHG